MSITYSWKITGIKTKTHLDIDNVVVQTYWEKTGVDENGNEGIFKGATPFSPEQIDPETHIPFEQLSEEQVISWIQSIVVGHYEEHVNETIKKEIDKKTFEISDAVLPWTIKTSKTTTKKTTK